MTRFHSEAWTPPKFDHRHVPKGETRYDGQTDMQPPTRDDNEAYFAGIVWRPNPAGLAAVLAAEKAAAKEVEPTPVVLEVAAHVATGQTAQLDPAVADYLTGMMASSVHHA